MHTAEQRAETTFGGYTVEVVHHIDATGTVAGQQVTTNSVPKLTFSLDDRQAVLQAGSTPEAIGKPVTITEPSRVAVTRRVPATVPILRWDIPIKVLRLVAMGLGVASLVLAVLGLGLNRQPKSAFGKREVRASNIDFGDRSLVDVDDAAALAKLADLHDTVVLHLVQSHDDLFLVVVDQTVYRYAEPSTGGQESVVEHRESSRDTT